MSNYPPGCTGSDDEPSWCDAARDYESLVESAINGCVLTRKNVTESIIDECDGVTAKGTVSLSLDVEGPLCEWFVKTRNALAAVVHQIDMRLDVATADDRMLRLEL